MASETDVRIARAVALKVAARMMAVGPTTTADVMGCAEKFIPWLLDVSAPARSDGDPSPTPDPTQPAEWPEDEAIGPPADSAPQGFAKPPPQTCLCGANMEYNVATATRSAAYFCPNKVKSRDKAEQDRQSALHPAVWQ